MQTATRVPTKRRTTKCPVTATVLRNWVADLKSGKYTLRSKDHGMHLLTDVKGKAEWDVFGLLFDRVADEWVLGRKSNVHTETFYYVPTIGGNRVEITTLLPQQVITKLMNLTYAGATAKQLADAITGMKSIILT